MQFTEEKAIELTKAHSLASGTRAVWRTRGKIPDKYVPGFVKPESVTNRKLLEDIFIIVRSGKINLGYWSEISGLTPSKIADVKRWKSSFSDADLLKLKESLDKELDIVNDWRTGESEPDISKLIIPRKVTGAKPFKWKAGKKNLSENDPTKTALSAKIIKWRNVLELEKEDEERVFAWKMGKQNISKDLRWFVFYKLAVFIVLTKERLQGLEYRSEIDLHRRTPVDWAQIPKKTSSLG